MDANIYIYIYIYIYIHTYTFNEAAGMIKSMSTSLLIVVAVCHMVG